MSQTYSAPLEKTIQAKIMAYLKTLPETFAWKVHTGGPYSCPGIPDILCVRTGRLYAFEVKRPGRKPTPLQEATLWKLREAGAVTAVVTGVEEVRSILDGDFDV